MCTFNVIRLIHFNMGNLHQPWTVFQQVCAINTFIIRHTYTDKIHKDARIKYRDTSRPKIINNLQKNETINIHQLKIIIMEYLQHDYILTWTAYEPLMSCLSCNKWSCGTYQNCWKEWNALIRQRSYREPTYCERTGTEMYMWDSINCAISAEWRPQKLW